MILRNPSSSRDFLFMACLFLSLLSLSFPAQSQGLQGIVKDLASQQPINGVQITLSLGDSVITTMKTNKEGRFSYKTNLTGRYQLFVSAKNFQPSFLDNVILDGYTTHQLNFLMEKISIELDGVTVVATHPANETSVHKITREDLNTVAGNFDDPIRVALSRPGFVSLNDQANHFSARGHSP